MRDPGLAVAIALLIVLPSVIAFLPLSPNAGDRRRMAEMAADGGADHDRAGGDLSLWSVARRSQVAVGQRRCRGGHGPVDSGHRGVLALCPELRRLYRDVRDVGRGHHAADLDVAVGLHRAGRSRVERRDRTADLRGHDHGCPPNRWASAMPSRPTPAARSRDARRVVGPEGHRVSGTGRDATDAPTPKSDAIMAIIVLGASLWRLRKANARD